MCNSIRYTGNNNIIRRLGLKVKKRSVKLANSFLLDVFTFIMIFL